MINFTHIFQDCWNFVRNQQKITLQFTALLFIVSVFALFFKQSIQTDTLELSETISNTETLQLSHYLFISGLLRMFISAWGILTIHQLSQHIEPQLSQSVISTAKRFGGLLLLNILIAIPLGIGTSEILVSAIMHKSPSIFSLFALALGIFVFVRLNLLNVHYLIHNHSISQSLKTMWKSGVKRTHLLFLYTLINCLLPFLLRQLSLFLSHNLFMEILITAIISLAEVFLLIFTYRFYTLFMQQRGQ
ncbi:hypothetical protein [Histophilus somni]|uniref:hypothetical protein n=1 Tax=Histophilus somni TaxID=731 RepID=UPI00003975F4|nr:hypothetical protein [Histophilus somni]ACA32466.1 putative membrane protein [Histophilus somni 2336]QQF86568.1 hypothetical protein JFL55_02575 [Histophilus somni]QQJ89628.1 hypothetical protein JFJ84_07760 [Histophilus somni]